MCQGCSFVGLGLVLYPYIEVTQASRIDTQHTSRRSSGLPTLPGLKFGVLGCEVDIPAENEGLEETKRTEEETMLLCQVRGGPGQHSPGGASLLNHGY